MLYRAFKSGDIIDVNVFAEAEAFTERVVFNPYHAL
jgi:hypothetical protein